MDPLRLHAVAARVVAWHNRHPLARRITAAQVHSVGYVALPYATPDAAGAVPLVATAVAEGEGDGGGSLRERAAARARQQAEGFPAVPPPATPAVAAPPATVQAAFSEDFIAPLKPRQVARWAARHGRVLAQTPVNGPLREIEADGLQPGHRPLTLYVLTAAIELGDQRHRVLLAGGDDPALLGRRLMSRPRLAAWTLTPSAALAALLLLPRLQLPMTGAGTGQVAAVQAPARPAPPPAASAASRAPHFEEPPPPAAQLHTVALVAQPASAASSAATAVAAAPTDRHGTAPAAPRLELPAAPPQDVEPRLGRITLPPLSLPINDEAKEAARQARLARQPAPPAPAASATALAAAPGAQAHTPPAPAPVATVAPVAPVAPLTTAAASPPPAPRAAATPLPAHGAAFAVSTRTLRTRAEAEQIATAMVALLKDQAELRVDVLPQGDDWRVVGWPFPGAAQADKARALLASRGMRVAVVDF